MQLTRKQLACELAQFPDVQSMDVLPDPQWADFLTVLAEQADLARPRPSSWTVDDILAPIDDAFFVDDDVVMAGTETEQRALFISPELVFNGFSIHNEGRLSRLAAKFSEESADYPLAVIVRGQRHNGTAQLQHTQRGGNKASLHLYMNLPRDHGVDEIRLFAAMSLQLKQGFDQPTTLHVDTLSNLVRAENEIVVKGVGTTMIQVAVKFKHFLKEQGVSVPEPIRLTSLNPAVGFYEKCLFRRDGNATVYGSPKMYLPLRFESIFLCYSGYAQLREQLDAAPRARLTDGENTGPPKKKRRCLVDLES